MILYRYWHALALASAISAGVVHAQGAAPVAD
ncbi:MAG: hypothetical protein ACJAWY_000771, partial [Sphingomonas echinoides]